MTLLVVSVLLVFRHRFVLSGDEGRSVGRGVRGPALPTMDEAECRRLAERGQRLRKEGIVRVGSWNVRWFPDGRPGAAKSGDGPRRTHVERLACEIAALGVDVIALQEIKRTERGRLAMERLARRLSELTGGTWTASYDGCRGKGRQHLAVLHDRDRVTASRRRDVAALNPHGEGACARMLRPGLALYFERPGGADFHLIAVHLKSGVKRSDLTARQRSVEGILRAYEEATGLVDDSDIVLLGDFNTMGCPRCKPKVSPEEELERIDALLAGSRVPLRRVPSDIGCSEYYRGRGGLLDHFVISSAMAEVEARATTAVGGYCAERRCRRWGKDDEPPSAYLDLSDHCPIVLEIRDEDLD